MNPSEACTTRDMKEVLMRTRFASATLVKVSGSDAEGSDAPASEFQTFADGAEQGVNLIMGGRGPRPVSRETERLLAFRGWKPGRSRKLKNS